MAEIDGVSRRCWPRRPPSTTRMAERPAVPPLPGCPLASMSPIVAVPATGLAVERIASRRVLAGDTAAGGCAAIESAAGSRDPAISSRPLSWRRSTSRWHGPRRPRMPETRRPRRDPHARSRRSMTAADGTGRAPPSSNGVPLAAESPSASGELVHLVAGLAPDSSARLGCESGNGHEH